MSKSNCVEKYIDDYLNKDSITIKNQCYNKFEKLCNKKNPFICIFGAGDNGKRLYYEITKRLISVDCFSDNDSNKWGIVLEEIFCIPPSYLELEKENILVIVAMEIGKESVIQQLNHLGVHYVITEEQFKNEFRDIPKAMPLGCIEKLDYTSDESNYLIGKFNTLLRDTCRYYEDRIDKLTVQSKDEA